MISKLDFRQLAKNISFIISEQNVSSAVCFARSRRNDWTRKTSWSTRGWRSSATESDIAEASARLPSPQPWQQRRQHHRRQVRRLPVGLTTVPGRPFCQLRHRRQVQRWPLPVYRSATATKTSISWCPIVSWATWSTLTRTKTVKMKLNKKTESKFKNVLAIRRESLLGKIVGDYLKKETNNEQCF